MAYSIYDQFSPILFGWCYLWQRKLPLFKYSKNPIAPEVAIIHKPPSHDGNLPLYFRYYVPLIYVRLRRIAIVVQQDYQ